MNRRIGRFSMSDEIKDSAAVRAVLGRCDVVERRDNPSHCRTDYVAFSPDFDLIEWGDEVPQYDWIIRPLPDGSSAVEAKRYVPDPEIQATIARLFADGIFD